MLCKKMDDNTTAVIISPQTNPNLSQSLEETKTTQESKLEDCVNKIEMENTSAIESSPSENLDCHGPNMESSTFKVPCLIGPKLPQAQKHFENKDSEDQELKEKNDNNKIVNAQIEQLISESSKNTKPEKSQPSPVSYKEPYWSGTAKAAYHVEILKSGVIVDNVNLNTLPFYVIGRLPTCNIILEHPSISRHHAVIQYRSEESDANPPGFYLYDLNSTHGTFLNKQQIQARRYYRLRVGYMFKFGGSSRMFILQGPDDDQEEESELSVTELKELRKQQEEKLKKLEMAENDDCSIEDVSEDQGIDWGMGEDAEEEDDLSENPFALDSIAPNEDLYINDPKKTLRGWFEREGYDLEYDVEDKGYSQFICRVQLPLDSPTGGSIFAEATVKGKKKEAVIACALEACRILDRHGLLRQSNHESRKRKQKNWEEEDYYDSDEDTFLDRTGTIEKKRQQRIQRSGKEEKKIETYDSLVSKLQEIKEEIKNVEHTIETSKNTSNEQTTDVSDDVDELDVYMSSIHNETVVDKCRRTSLKQRLSHLLQEELRLQRLVNIAKPTNLPEIKCNSNQPLTLSEPKKSFKKLMPLTGTMKGYQKNKSLISTSKTDSLKETCRNVKEGEIEVTSETKEMSIINNMDVKTIEEQRELLANNDNITQMERTNSSSPQRETTTSTVKLNVRKSKIRKIKPDQAFEYDASNPDYALWMPPTDQSGDGKTKLNEKFGY